MTYFTPGKNTHLDHALGIISPHAPHTLGLIEVWESDKILAFLEKRGRHQTFRLLHRHGSDALIEYLVMTNSISGGHRLKFTTRVDEVLMRRENSTPSPVHQSPGEPSR